MDKQTISFLQPYLRQNKKAMVLSVILSVCSVMTGFLPYFAVFWLMTGLVAHTLTWQGLLILSLVSVLGYFLKTLFFELSTTLSHKSAYGILQQIRLDLTEKFMRVPLGYVVDEPIGKFKNLTIDQVENLELPLAHLIPEGAAYMLAPLAVCVILLFVHPLMALASLLSCIAGMMLSAPMMAKMSQNYDAYMKSSDAMNSTIVEYLEGIEVIKTFNQGEASYGKFKQSVESFRKLTLQWFRSTWVSGNLMMTIMPSTLLGVLPVGMLLYVHGSLSPEELVLAIVLSLALIGPIMGLSTYMNNLKMIRYAARSVGEVLEQQELPDKQEQVELYHFDITFQHVDFSYHAEEKILKDLSFQIPEGSFSALIGPSGGGKSTVARLISRFWDVTDGRILLGGKDIRDIPLSQLSHYISFVAQDNYLFNASIRENIRMGNPEATDEQVYEAAKKACCHDFIMELEHGYDSMAGQAGSRLSGGEKQRIAIARMILRNAPVVILDEATAYTDPENEEKIQQAISNLTKGKTLLVIAHRLSTISGADSIMILKKGQLAATGTHQELLRTSPLYQSMWQAHMGAKNHSLQGGQCHV